MKVRHEIKPLTGLRGVAAIYVIFFHYFPGVAMSNPVKTLVAHGYLAVDLFFVLSGFVMALNYGHMFEARWSPATYLQFLGRRIARIYPLYLAGTLCGFAFVLLGWLDPFTQGTPATNFLSNIFLVQVWGLSRSFDGPGWSISAEWAAYLVFPLLLIPALFSRRRMAVLCGAISVCTIAMLSLLPASITQREEPNALLDISSHYHALPVLRCIPEFLLGILVYRVFSNRSVGPFGFLPHLAPVLSLAVIAGLAIPRADLAVVVLYPVLLLSLSFGDSLPARILSSTPAMLAGRLSYSIYLIHGLLNGLLGWFHHRADTLGLAHGQTIGAVLCIFLTFPAAWLAYTCIEVPGRAWLQALFTWQTGSRIRQSAA